MGLFGEFKAKLDELALTSIDDPHLYTLMDKLEYVLDDLQVGYEDSGDVIYDCLNSMYEEALLKVNKKEVG